MWHGAPYPNGSVGDPREAKGCLFVLWWAFDPKDNDPVQVFAEPATDALLMAAEASNENGDTSNAIQYLNEVRNRVNLFQYEIDVTQPPWNNFSDSQNYYSNGSLSNSEYINQAEVEAELLFESGVIGDGSDDFVPSSERIDLTLLDSLGESYVSSSIAPAIRLKLNNLVL